MKDEYGNSKVPEDELKGERYSWGEGIPTQENYSLDHSCINKKCSSNGKYGGKRNKDYAQVIGVKKAPFPKQNKDYALVFQCHQCSTQFWSHIFNEDARKISEAGDAYSPYT